MRQKKIEGNDRKKQEKNRLCSMISGDLGELSMYCGGNRKKSRGKQERNPFLARLVTRLFML
ncbi:hypothetical protein PPE_05275 [Paenibacillus polymyxa E681]|nr:hypothetical protein PPE_05275 [Paenibacillus polymyxa E681]